MRDLAKKILAKESGAAFIEYVLGIAVLVVVFLVASRVLNTAARDRADNSIRAIQGMAPCGGAAGKLNTDSGSLECM